MAVGLRGVFLCCKRAVEQMLGQEPLGEVRGRVINISSQHGHGRDAGPCGLLRGKGGVVNLTRQLAVDFGRRGIMVNAIAPGKILTAPTDEPDTDEILEYSHARTPFSRLGRPDDVAGAAVFLASDDAPTSAGRTSSSTAAGWPTDGRVPARPDQPEHDGRATPPRWPAVARAALDPTRRSSRSLQPERDPAIEGDVGHVAAAAAGRRVRARAPRPRRLAHRLLRRPRPRGRPRARPTPRSSASARRPYCAGLARPPLRGRHDAAPRHRRDRGRPGRERRGATAAPASWPWSPGGGAGRGARHQEAIVATGSAALDDLGAEALVLACGGMADVAAGGRATASGSRCATAWRSASLLAHGLWRAGLRTSKRGALGWPEPEPAPGMSALRWRPRPSGRTAGPR